MLSGIASGVGIGFIRGMSTSACLLSVLLPLLPSLLTPPHIPRISSLLFSRHVVPLLTSTARASRRGRVLDGAGVFVASNWAVGTFTLISLGTWCVYFLGLHCPSSLTQRHPLRCVGGSEAEHRCRTICQRSRTEERRRMQQVVEAMPKRFVKDDAAGTGEQKAT